MSGISLLLNIAQGAMLAGLVASRVLYRGESLVSFKLQMGGFVAFFVAFILGPLLMFTPRMARAKRKGLADYGLLAQRYVDRFEQKWVMDNPAPSDEAVFLSRRGEELCAGRWKPGS